MVKSNFYYTDRQVLTQRRMFSEQQADDLGLFALSALSLVTCESMFKQHGAEVQFSKEVTQLLCIGFQCTMLRYFF